MTTAVNSLSPGCNESCKRKRPLNTGVCLARVFFSFLVVCNHYFSHGIGASWIIPLRDAAVPVFFVLAFYFLEGRTTMPGSCIRRRLYRILVPLWFWGSVFAIPYFIGFVSREWSIQTTVVALQRILLQLALGHVYDAPLWFLFDLAVLTGAWLLMRETRIVRQRATAFLASFFAISMILQYSGVNEGVFGKLNWFIRHPLGRLVECVPFAIAGIALARSRLVAKLSNSRFRILHLVWICLLCWPFPILGQAPSGFGYQGLHLVRSGSFLAALFLILPTERMPNRLKERIQGLSRYSLGVYCIHVPVGAACLSVFRYLGIDMDPFFRCLAIYAVSWCSCWMLAWTIPRTRKVVQ